MDEKELIRAVSAADQATLKKVKAVVDFRVSDKDTRGGKGMDSEERQFYNAIVKTLARNNAGFANYEDAEHGTRLPGFNLQELREAKEAVDQVYSQSFGDSTLTRERFYRLMASCAFRSIEDQQKRRYALDHAKRVLSDHNPDKEVAKALRHLIDVFSRETLTINRSVKGMLAVLKYADDVLDEAFPGYARSGLLQMIVRRYADAKQVNHQET